MQLRINLTGQKFGKLKVLKYVNRNKYGDSIWLCLCDCGQQKTISNSDLKTGNTKSCGCFRVKHGHSINNDLSQTYIAWAHMKQRCNNKKDPTYLNYGNRGITVCKRWFIFENFLKDMGEPPTKNHSLDRVNNNGNYCKNNCRWATKKQQQGNMRSNHMIVFSGQTKCIAEWARKTGIGQKCLWHRLVTLKWSVKKALTTPVKRRKL